MNRGDLPHIPRLSTYNTVSSQAGASDSHSYLRLPDCRGQCGLIIRLHALMLSKKPSLTSTPSYIHTPHRYADTAHPVLNKARGNQQQASESCRVGQKKKLVMPVCVQIYLLSLGNYPCQITRRFHRLTTRARYTLQRATLRAREILAPARKRWRCKEYILCT